MLLHCRPSAVAGSHERVTATQRTLLVAAQRRGHVPGFKFGAWAREMERKLILG